MKHFFIICVYLVGAFCLHAQDIPVDWNKYTGEDYFFDIQHDVNNKNYTESQFQKLIQETAYSSLARKVEVQVNEFSSINKSAVNGKSNINYRSSTEFSTKINLALTDYKYQYNPQDKSGIIIVYINKSAASMFYKNNINLLLSNADNAIEKARSYIEKGFKEQARKGLESVTPIFGQKDEPFFWLNFYGIDTDDYNELQEECNQREQTVKQMLADLRHGIFINIECKAELFGQQYTALENVLKSQLTNFIDCSFTQDKQQADWIITINAQAREYNSVNHGNAASFFSYVDTNLTIYKVATSQTIYNDELSVKGGHTHNYTEAGRDAYKKLTSQLSKILKDNIKE